MKKFYQKRFIKLKGPWKLFLNLIDAVEPLQEHGTPFVDVVVIGGVSITLRKLVAKHEPVQFDQHTETL